MGKKTFFTIRNRMLLSYFIIAVLLMITGIIGLFYIGKVYDNGNKIYEEDLKVVEYLETIRQNVNKLDNSVFHLVVDMKWNHSDAAVDEIDNLLEENLTLMSSYSALDVPNRSQDVYERGTDNLLEYQRRIKVMIDNVGELSEDDLLEQYQEELVPMKDAANVMLDEAVSIMMKNADAINEDNRLIYHRIIWIICLVVFAAFVIAIFISLAMSNYVLSKLKSIQLMAKRISEYNISDDIEEFENDEFGQTVKALNESQFMIRDLLEKIISESTTISDMGEEVSLAVRKSEQRIEQVNVSILEYEKLSMQIEKHVKQLVEKRTVSEEEKATLKQIKDKLDETKTIRENARTELSSIATYLEQIGITSDYQNEIANSHKEQVKKFKVKEREETT